MMVKHLLVALVLSGCASAPVEVMVPVDKYVVRTATPEIKALPERLPPAHAKIGSDDEAAKFVIGTEAYIKQLEAKIGELVKFFERPISQEQP